MWSGRPSQLMVSEGESVWRSLCRLEQQQRALSGDPYTPYLSNRGSEATDIVGLQADSQNVSGYHSATSRCDSHLCHLFLGESRYCAFADRADQHRATT